MVLCTVWLCVSLEVRKMNWEESLLDFQSGLKLTSFSSYECIPLHGYSNLFKIEKPERNWEWCIAAIGSSWLLSLHLLSRLKTGLIHFEAGSTGFYHGWIFSLLWLWADGFFALLCMEGIDRAEKPDFLSSVLSSQVMSLLCLPYICRLPLGLISSGRAEAVGHSISALCMLSVPALPFFSKGRGNNLGCPPARRKWVTDNPWTFPKGYSVALLQGHWHTCSAFIAAPKPTSKQLYLLWFLSIKTVHISVNVFFRTGTRSTNNQIIIYI